MIKKALIKILSPAKLNLFLHVLERRRDGYHNLQTLFQLVEAGDAMTFSKNTIGKIRISVENLEIPDSENLVFRAAKSIHRPGLGADITLHKSIPTGAGLGGGSSNAASTLVVLNYLWKLGYKTYFTKNGENLDFLTKKKTINYIESATLNNFWFIKN